MKKKLNLFLFVIIVILVNTTILPNFFPAYGKNGKTTQQPEFFSNEILVKVKKHARDSIKEGNAAQSGLEMLAILDRREQIASFTRISPSGLNTSLNQELYSWYKIVLQTPGKKLSPSHPEFTQYQKLLRHLKADSKIDKVEPNYLVTTNLIPNDPYFSSTGSWGKVTQIYGDYTRLM